MRTLRPDSHVQSRPEQSCGLITKRGYAGGGEMGKGGGGTDRFVTMCSSVLMTPDCPHDFRVPQAAAWP